MVFEATQQEWRATWRRHRSRHVWRSGARIALGWFAWASVGVALGVLLLARLQLIQTGLGWLAGVGFFCACVVSTLVGFRGRWTQTDVALHLDRVLDAKGAILTAATAPDCATLTINEALIALQAPQRPKPPALIRTHYLLVWMGVLLAIGANLPFGPNEPVPLSVAAPKPLHLRQLEALGAVQQLKRVKGLNDDQERRLHALSETAARLEHELRSKGAVADLAARIRRLQAMVRAERKYNWLHATSGRSADAAHRSPDGARSLFEAIARRDFTAWERALDDARRSSRSKVAIRKTLRDAAHQARERHQQDLAQLLWQAAQSLTSSGPRQDAISERSEVFEDGLTVAGPSQRRLRRSARPTDERAETSIGAPAHAPRPRPPTGSSNRSAPPPPNARSLRLEDAARRLSHALNPQLPTGRHASTSLADGSPGPEPTERALQRAPGKGASIGASPSTTATGAEELAASVKVPKPARATRLSARPRAGFGPSTPAIPSPAKRGRGGRLQLPQASGNMMSVDHTRIPKEYQDQVRRYFSGE